MKEKFTNTKDKTNKKLLNIQNLELHAQNSLKPKSTRVPLKISRPLPNQNFPAVFVPQKKFGTVITGS